MRRYNALQEDTDSSQFTNLFGDWKPSNETSLSAVPPLPPETQLNASLTELEKIWVNDFSNQIHDLENLLDKETRILTKNYLQRKITLIHHDDHTFVIEMLREREEVDDEETEIKENNIYLQGEEIPIYTENVTDKSSEILGNFWISFLEHGLPQYLSNL